MSGGGGSGPTATTVTNQNIPDWMQPYVLGDGKTKGLLPQASALTDTSKNPYQQYNGQQVADLSPMQKQAMSNVQGMGVSSQIDQATGMAGQAGTGAANIGSTYHPGQIGYNQTGINSFNGAGTAQSYMSPYMQNVVEHQKAGAISDYANTLPGMSAVAANTGNLGSSRQALMQSQAQRGLQGTLGNIEATGTQNAFQNAQQQFNNENALGFQSQHANQQAGLMAQGQNLQSQQFGSNLGLQGLQLENSAAGTMGQLGHERYSEQAGINTALNTLGSEQQGTKQAELSAQYQNFLNRQNYPYAQLSYMSDLIHGTSTAAGGSGGVYNYAQPPEVVGQVAGLGVGAAGLAGLFEHR